MLSPQGVCNVRPVKVKVKVKVKVEIEIEVKGRIGVRDQNPEKGKFPSPEAACPAQEPLPVTREKPGSAGNQQDPSFMVLMNRSRTLSAPGSLLEHRFKVVPGCLVASGQLLLDHDGNPQSCS